MPSYEYRCLNCKKRFEIFMTYAEYGTRLVTCSHCGSDQVQRKIGRVRVARSDSSRLDAFASPESLANIDDDPRQLGRMMRQMSGELGEDMGPEFHEVIGRLEAGQLPEDIEKDLPELADDMGAGGLDSEDYAED